MSLDYIFDGGSHGPSVWMTHDAVPARNLRQIPSITAPTSELDAEGVGAWAAYLDHLAEDGIDQAQTAWQLWRTLSSSIESLPIPDADLTPNGGLLVWWRTPDHHAELELPPDGAIEWFVRHPTTGHFEGGEWDRTNEPPEALLSMLRQLRDAREGR